jgi:hypothetical protein
VETQEGSLLLEIVESLSCAISSMSDVIESGVKIFLLNMALNSCRYWEATSVNMFIRKCDAKRGLQPC